MFASALPDRGQMLPPFYQTMNYMGLSPHNQMAAAAAEMMLKVGMAQNQQSVAAATRPHFPPFLFGAAPPRSVFGDTHHTASSNPFYATRPPHLADFSLIQNHTTPSASTHCKLSPMHKTGFLPSFAPVSQNGLLSSVNGGHPSAAVFHHPAQHSFSHPFGLRPSACAGQATYLNNEHNFPLPLGVQSQKNVEANVSFKRGFLVRVNGDVVRPVEDLSLADFENSLAEQHMRSSSESHLNNGTESERVSYKLDHSRLLLLEENHANGMVRYVFAGSRNDKKRSIELPVAYPFFVPTRGWCATEPTKTREIYGLDCQKLQVGDVCASLIKRIKRKRFSPASTTTTTTCPTKLRQSNKKSTSTVDSSIHVQQQAADLSISSNHKASTFKSTTGTAAFNLHSRKRRLSQGTAD